MAVQRSAAERGKWRLLKRSNKQWWILVVCVLALAVLIAAAQYGYPKYQQARAVKTAHRLLDQQDYHAAALAVQRALYLNPGHLEANRIMAEATERGRSRQALAWRQRVAEFQPGVLQNYLAWAKTALNFRDVAAAEQALVKVDEAGKRTAAFQNMAGRVAQAKDDLATAETHFAEAARIEPENPLYRLDFGVMRLRSPDMEARQEARSSLEKLVAVPELRQRALQGLIVDAMERKDGDKAVEWAHQAQSGAGATFDDRLRYLTLLRQLVRPNFSTYLAEFQEQVRGNPVEVGRLMAWLNSNKMAKLSVLWSSRLPEEFRSQMPLPVIIAESYEAMNDWPAVKTLVSDVTWGDLESIRLALLARALRDEGEESGWQVKWGAAMNAGADRPEMVAMLARSAGGWGWEDEAAELLWKVAQGPADPQGALKELQRIYAAQGNTRALFRVATRMIELQPQNAMAQHDFARLSFLLNANMDRAQKLAREAHAKEPGNAAAAFIYSYALHLQGKTEEGLKIMRRHGKEELERPAQAAYYGVLLASTGARDEASRYLSLAEKGELLPEEKTLVDETREKLRRSAVH